MNIIRYTVLPFIVLLAISWEVGAVSGAKLLVQSSSGQTAVFNLGAYDGVKEGDFAVILKQIRSLDSKDLRLVPVARAKNIKINTESSIWILYKVLEQELLVKGESYLVLSESALLNGRRDPRLKKLKIITNKKEANQVVKSSLNHEKERLSKLKKYYEEIETLKESEDKSSFDVTQIDVDSWSRVKGDRFNTSLYRGPHKEEFQRELRLATFEKIVTAYLKKVNDPDFSYDKFYDEQMKVNFANEFKKRSNFSTEYEKFLSQQAIKAASDAKVYRTILERGEAWSEDFSDEELRIVMNEVSVLQEKDRRSFVASRPNRYATYLSFGMNFLDSQTENDPGYRRDGRFSIEGEFEGIPVLKHEVLERFSLSAFFRMNKDAFQYKDFNASLDEHSFGVGLNWYPLYAPYAIEAPVLFLGTYIRSGWAQVSSPSAFEKSNYTLLAMPSFRAGMRYNFKNGLGMRISLSMESLSLDRYERSELNAQLPSQVATSEGKMNFALAYSF